ncbi:Integrin beta-2 [Portunus trituberculatus]|uniref:Integrin beta-2 n=1 Tax=Portunus trituberculatus TaxID=210409 RepID=A0A5B7CMK8_PORTR|nr:Integrin beta-2 [Portunus trituberculatus]
MHIVVSSDERDAVPFAMPPPTPSHDIPLSVHNCEENCHEYTSCVKCLVSGSEAACNATCSGYDVTIVSDMSKVYGLPCSSTSDDECRIFYQFKHKKGAVSLWIQKQKECPEEINVWAVMGGILGAVVVVGLLLLIAWKIVTHFKDKREYETFMKNRSMAIWSERTAIVNQDKISPRVSASPNELFTWMPPNLLLLLLLTMIISLYPGKKY